MAKKKWTKGWLTRDGKFGRFSDDIFLCINKKPVLIMDEWQIMGLTLIQCSWSVDGFIKTYGKKNLPDYGQCIEVEIEL